jgi:hypothetical protein
MEYLALFIWLALCLLMGALMHFAMAGALTHRGVQLLAAPGMVIRKVSMVMTALVCGATVTKVSIYELSAHDIDFRAEGMASVGKVLVPLAPVFGGAVAMMQLNALFGSPLNLHYAPPDLSALNGTGFKGFFHGTWLVLSSVVSQAIQADWHSLRLYVLFALVFSLALGACAPMERVKEALLGGALLAVVMALLSSIALRKAGVVAASPGWFTTARAFIVDCSGIAFLMMVYGMLAALAVGGTVRIYEMMAKGGSKAGARGKGKGKSAKVDEEEMRRAA